MEEVNTVKKQPKFMLTKFKDDKVSDLEFNQKVLMDVKFSENVTNFL